MFDFQDKKPILGSVGNRTPIEDPVAGNNGTAVIIRIRDFIDVVEESLNLLAPNSKGSLITANTNGDLVNVNLGPSNFSLVSQPSSLSGMAWIEMVSLDTEQTILAHKTFNGGLSATNISATESISAGVGITTPALSSTEIDGAIARLTSSLSVDGPGTINSLTVNESLSADTTSLGNTTTQNLSVSGQVNVSDGIQIVKDLLLGGNLVVNGSSTFNSLTLQGPLTADSLQTGDIDGNATRINSLSVNNDAIISGTLNVGSNLTAGATTVNSLTSLGHGSFTALSATEIVGTSLTLTDKLTGISAEFAEELTADSAVISRSLQSGSLATNHVDSTSLSTGDITGANLVLTGDGLIQTLEVTGAISSNSITTGAVTGSTFDLAGGQFSGPVRANSSLYVYGTANIDGLVQLGGNLELTKSITARSITLNQSVVTYDIRTEQAVVNQDLEVQGVTRLRDLSAGHSTLFSLEVQDDVEIKGSAKIEELEVTRLIGSTLSGTNTGDEVDASGTEKGIVRLNTDGSPIVYRKSEVDSLFVSLNSVGNTIAPLSAGKIPPQYLPDIATGGEGEIFIPSEGDYDANMISLDPPIRSEARVGNALSQIDQALEDHEAEINPHNINPSTIGAIADAEKNAANGVAALINGKILESVLPESTYTSTSATYTREYETSEIAGGSISVLHNLNEEFPHVTVWYNRKVLIPDEILSVSANEIVITIINLPTDGDWVVRVSK